MTNSTTSQVDVSPPPTAIAPMVSTTTMAEMRKKIVSTGCAPELLPLGGALRTVMTIVPGSVHGQAAVSAGRTKSGTVVPGA